MSSSVALLAEAGHVGVLARVLVAAPGVVGAGDLRDVVVGQLAVHAVDHRAELAGVDEERLAAPVAEAAVLSCRGRGTTGRPGSASSRRAGPGSATMQSTRSASMMALRISPSPDWFDDIEPLASTKPAMPGGREVVDEVLHPGVVGVARRRHAVLPALVVLAAARRASRCR